MFIFTFEKTIEMGEVLLVVGVFVGAFVIAYFAIKLVTSAVFKSEKMGLEAKIEVFESQIRDMKTQFENDKLSFEKQLQQSNFEKETIRKDKDFLSIQFQIHK